MPATVSGKLGRASGGIVIGEWSGAVNPASLQALEADFEEKREFVNAQLALFDKYCGGWFFWTYKKEQRGDTGWSWQDTVEGGIFPTSVGIKYRRIEADDIMNRTNIRDDMKEDALGNLFFPSLLVLLLTIPTGKHFQYWSHYPGYYDHSRFGSGVGLGWVINRQGLNCLSPAGTKPKPSYSQPRRDHRRFLKSGLEALGR